MSLPGFVRQRASDQSVDRPLHARVWAGYGALTVVFLSYVGFVIARRHDPYSTVVDGWLVDAFEIVASGLCLARGVTHRSVRWPAISLGLGLLSWALGDVVLTIQSLGGATPPSPSAADGFYLAFYPLTYVAVMLFMRGQMRRLTTPNWLDGAVAGLGAAAVCAAFVFHRIQHTVGGGTWSVAINLAYPVGDVLLLSLVVGGSALLAGRRKAPWILLATGIACIVVGDTFNLLGSSVDAGQIGSISDAIAWPSAILLMSMAMWVRPRPAVLLATQRPTGFALPGVAALAGLVVLFIASFRHPGRIAVGLALATMVTVGVRLALSVRSLRTLTEERRRQSVTDELTGLGNRRYLSHVLDAFSVEQADESVPTRELAFLFVDLDHFKEVNDSFGHPAGDELLRQLGPRLTASLRPTDVLIRLGGDEFVVVLLDTDAAGAVMAAERLTASLEEPFDLHSARAQVGSSIGIALAPADATDATGLLWCADVAMYRAKLSGSPFALYDPDLDHEGHRWRLVEELRTAVDDGEFVLHYQPQLDLQTGEIRTAEALLRWPHPRLGLVPPMKFLPLAEEAGLMRELTAWVLDQALQQCAAWRAAGRRMTVAVNISATNLLDNGFAAAVGEALRRHGLPPDALLIEITETSVIGEFARAKEVIDDLRAQGFVVSIDDFGAGFTSLAHLSGLAVQELKLDRAFITDLARHDQGRNRQLVRSTIELAHALGLRVVAEGIEDVATLDLVTDLGCDIAQGYFISKPKPAAELAFRPDVTVAQPAAIA